MCHALLRKQGALLSVAWPQKTVKGRVRQATQKTPTPIRNPAKSEQGS